MTAKCLLRYLTLIATGAFLGLLIIGALIHTEAGLAAKKVIEVIKTIIINCIWVYLIPASGVTASGQVQEYTLSLCKTEEVKVGTVEHAANNVASLISCVLEVYGSL